MGDRRTDHAAPEPQLLCEQPILAAVPRYMLETIVYRLHVALCAGLFEDEALVGRLIIFVHRADLVLEHLALRSRYHALVLQIRL